MIFVQLIKIIVQDMIKSRTSTRVKSYDWLLKGLVCCKECGKKISDKAQICIGCGCPIEESIEEQTITFNNISIKS